MLYGFGANLNAESHESCTEFEIRSAGSESARARFMLCFEPERPEPAPRRFALLRS